MPFGTGRKTHGRIVYLGKAARKAVWKYLAEREIKYHDDPLFLTDDDKPMTHGAIRLLLGRIGASAGVPKVHPHKFRHTFAVQFLRNGGNIYVLQRLLGHSSLEMVKRYLALVESDAAKAMQASSPADRWRL